jgi:LuxR family maltose regulon positive regulatory protein
MERLAVTSACKLTLVSAPAGFGKSTLLASWVSEHKQSAKIAWLSLDDTDNDLTRFLTYLVAALQTMAPGLGKGTAATIQSPGGINIEAVLTTLINEVSEISQDFVLILDDFHVIESPEIDKTTNYLIENMPANLHLVIASRIDPSLPLSRWRVNGQVCELRANDLRFTSEEAADFLNGIMHLDLTSEDVLALENRTEGWIAGLQLAALSMQSLQGRVELHNFIRSFAGSHRYIQDYLTDEVLRRQPNETRDFLVQTSILKGFNASLCSAVTGVENCQEILEELEAANLFLVPLDGDRNWYRYHHLFADLLKQRLKLSQDHDMQELHLRAREWYSQQGQDRDALQHSLLAEDFETAAELINQLAMEVVQKGEYQTVSGWINALPESIQKSHPYLWALDVWALRMEGKFDAAESKIAEVEEAIEDPAHAGSEDLENIVGLINSHKAYIAFIRGDLDNSVAVARKSLTQLPPGLVVIQTLTTLYLGVALRYQGKLQEALEIYTDALKLGRQLTGSSIAVFCFLHLSDLYHDLGKLSKSKEMAEQAIQFTAQHTGKPDWPFTGHAYVSIGRILRQWGQLTEALEFINRGVALCRQWNVADVLAIGCMEYADISFSLGDKEQAHKALQESFHIYQEFSPWGSGLIAAHQAKHSLGFGEVKPAVDWLKELDLDADSQIDISREIEFLTMARVYIVKDQLDEALALLDRLNRLSEELGKIPTLLETLILQAQALFIRGDTQEAFKKLEQALAIGETENYFQIFVDEGSQMAEIFSRYVKVGEKSDYVRMLLAAFEYAKTGASPRPAQPLIDPLSPREIEVLQLLAQGLTNREISERLFLALDTVKGHNRNIYGKLGVHNRTQAINKAISLKILPPR